MNQFEYQSKLRTRLDEALNKQLLRTVTQPGQPINFATQEELEAVGIGHKEQELIMAELRNVDQLPFDMEYQQRHDDFMAMLARIIPEA